MKKLFSSVVCMVIGIAISASNAFAFMPVCLDNAEIRVNDALAEYMQALEDIIPHLAPNELIVLRDGTISIETDSIFLSGALSDDNYVIMGSVLYSRDDKGGEHIVIPTKDEKVYYLHILDTKWVNDMYPFWRYHEGMSLPRIGELTLQTFTLSNEWRSEELGKVTFDENVLKCEFPQRGEVLKSPGREVGDEDSLYIVLSDEFNNPIFGARIPNPNK